MSALLQGHIVAEVCDLDNEPLVKMVGVEHVQTVVSHDIIGRLMIQCARQHGLAAVWQKIMGFEGAHFSVAGKFPCQLRENNELEGWWLT